MAGAQIKDQKKKELEEANKTDKVDDAASTYADQADEEKTDDSLETSELLEKLAEIKKSDQKLEDEFTSIIHKMPLSKNSAGELKEDGKESGSIFPEKEDYSEASDSSDNKEK